MLWPSSRKKIESVICVCTVFRDEPSSLEAFFTRRSEHLQVTLLAAWSCTGFAAAYDAVWTGMRHRGSELGLRQFFDLAVDLFAIAVVAPFVRASRSHYP